MNVILPNSNVASISLTPRITPTKVLTVTIKKDSTNTLISNTNDYFIYNGILVLTITLDTVQFIESESYKITIVEAGVIIYRGLLYCTSQDPQKFELTKDKYYF
jgi:hypothetical protein